MTRPTPRPTRIGTMIREARDGAGMSRNRLAEEIDLSPEWVQGIETGEILSTKLSVLHELARVLPALNLNALMVANSLAGIEADARRLNELAPPFPSLPERDLAIVAKHWPALDADDRAFILRLVERSVGATPES